MGDIKFAVCVSVWLFRSHLVQNCTSDIATILHRVEVCSRHHVLHFGADHPRGPASGAKNVVFSG